MRSSKVSRVQQIARELSSSLRKYPTHPEYIIWQYLRKKKLGYYKFLRQHPVFYRYNNMLRFFVADFYCHELRLIIEIDGPIHEGQVEYDTIRTKLLNNRNFQILRIKNQDIIDNPNEVLKRINKIIIEIESSRSHR